MSDNTAALNDPLSMRQPRRWWFVLGFANAAMTFAVAVLYFAWGQPTWVALVPFLWFYLGVPLLDTIVGEDNTNPPADQFEDLQRDPFYTNLIVATIPALALSYFGVMAMLMLGSLPWWAMALVVYAGGLGSGQAITLAHELGHRHDRPAQNWAKMALGLVGYGHFSIEHNRGHHVRVATPEDYSSARMNENVYSFALRDVLGAIKSAWSHEAHRLRNKNQALLSPHNEILQSYAITLVLAAVTVAWLGWAVLPWIIVHHGFAYFGLSMVNYVEHYGLKREKRANGRYEPCQPKHSWNTNHAVSNILQINLQRHSDHHANPSRPYQCLRNFDDLPRLPSGYPGCMGLVLIPPLWFNVMNPKARAWAGGDESKLNWGPAGAP